MVGNKTVLAAAAFAVAFVIVLLYLTLGLRRYRVEVCVVFRGRTECRTAAGGTREAAQRTAIENACAFLASGMADSIACSQTTPASVKWLE